MRRIRLHRRVPARTVTTRRPGAQRAGRAHLPGNVAHIDACDAVAANLDFFRGPEPDSGTCFEVGYAVARGKPVVGYIPEAGSFAQRIRQRHPQAVGPGLGDAHGWHLEEFGLPLNLMLGVPCRIVVGDLRAALELLRAEIERYSRPPARAASHTAS